MLVVTGFSPSGEQQYGRRMVESFDHYWPADVELVVYVEQETHLPRGVTRLLAEVPGWSKFWNRWKDDTRATGRGGTKAYDYRFDAAKFARQAFIAWDAAERLGTGLMTWFDGDTETIAPVPLHFLDELLGDASVAYLGRQRMWPEIGYVGYRVPEALPLLRDWKQRYADGSFQFLEQWHSAFVWREALKATKVKRRDLTSQVYEGKSHIWPVSPLGVYTKHYKGGKKKSKAVA